MSARPLMACFHGGGSNSTIFAIQAGRLQAALRADFEFVHFDAPFDRDAGPGVLPIFKDYAPFKTWFKSPQDATAQELLDGSGYDALSRDGIERVWSLMEAHAPVDRWVGAMGFSQGTRVVSGLLLDQQRRKELGKENGFNLGFGIMCMGSYAPMESEAGFAKGAFDGAAPELITTPTLHLHGLKDAQLIPGREQRTKYFAPGTTQLYEIDYHHAMPWVQSEIDHLAWLIREMAEMAKGDGGVKWE